MICHRCLLRFAKRNALPNTSHLRQISHTPRTRNATPVTAQTSTTTNPRPHDTPAATSTTAAQPFSDPLHPKPEKNVDFGPSEREKKKDAHVPSSAPAGTVLKGLNFMKGKQDPVALEDSEYPDWLWGVLRDVEKGKEGQANDEGDLFSKSKKQRRKAAKALRKQQLLNPELLQPKVPMYEQSVDLPAGDGSLQGAKEAGMARGELTKAMRENRRKKIKEDNFLRAMG